MKNMINRPILNIATKLYIKLRSGIVTPSQCTQILSARIRRMAWLLLIAGLLPMIAAAQTPAFTNAAAFATPIEVAENTTAVGGADYFGTSGTSTLTLGGTDMALFTLSAGGTLTFRNAPNFEMPRGIALSNTNTNDYAITVSAVNSVGTTPSGPITVRVTDVNEAPVLSSLITTGTFTEHQEGIYTFTATDVDAGQMLIYSLVGETHDATLTAAGVFTWTPGEDDGGEARIFSVRVTDSGDPPMRAVRAFSITVMELANRAPTSASITADSPVDNPATPTVTATATDPDSDMLTYTWSSSASGDTFDPETGASVTWMPATVTVATTVTLTVTVTDGNAAV